MSAPKPTEVNTKAASADVDVMKRTYKSKRHGKDSVLPRCGNYLVCYNTNKEGKRVPYSGCSSEVMCEGAKYCEFHRDVIEAFEANILRVANDEDKESEFQNKLEGFGVVSVRRLDYVCSVRDAEKRKVAEADVSIKALDEELARRRVQLDETDKRLQELTAQAFKLVGENAVLKARCEKSAESVNMHMPVAKKEKEKEEKKSVPLSSIVVKGECAFAATEEDVMTHAKAMECGEFVSVSKGAVVPVVGNGVVVPAREGDDALLTNLKQRVEKLESQPKVVNDNRQITVYNNCSFTTNVAEDAFRKIKEEALAKAAMQDDF